MILFLKNNLINICSEMTKIRMNLWMIYTCNMKGLEKVEKMVRTWMYLHRIIFLIEVVLVWEQITDYRLEELLEISDKFSTN